MPQPRRLPRPWSVEEHEESFVVADANKLPLAYVYFEDDFKRNWATLRGKPTKDEARRIATAIARLPDLIELERKAKTGELFGPPDDPTTGA